MGFKLAEAMQRICGFNFLNIRTWALAHVLTVSSRILQHMISYIFIPKGHQDEVSFFLGYSWLIAY